MTKSPPTSETTISSLPSLIQKLSVNVKAMEDALLSDFIDFDPMKDLQFLYSEMPIIRTLFFALLARNKMQMFLVPSRR